MRLCVQELRIDELKDFVDYSKFTEVTLANQLFSVELLKNGSDKAKEVKFVLKRLDF